jgi:hypothetical protein
MRRSWSELYELSKRRVHLRKFVTVRRLGDENGNNSAEGKENDGGPRRDIVEQEVKEHNALDSEEVEEGSEDEGTQLFDSGEEEEEEEEDEEDEEDEEEEEDEELAEEEEEQEEEEEEEEEGGEGDEGKEEKRREVEVPDELLQTPLPPLTFVDQLGPSGGALGQFFPFATEYQAFCAIKYTTQVMSDHDLGFELRSKSRIDKSVPKTKKLLFKLIDQLMPLLPTKVQTITISISTHQPQL